MSNTIEDNISDLFSKSHAAIDKFDYFMCSVSAGLCAYIGQTFSPHNSSLGYSLFTMMALISLALSFYGGYKRIQYNIAITKENQRLLELEEKLRQACETIEQMKDKEKAGSGIAIFTTDTGKKYTLSEKENQKESFQIEIAKLNQAIKSDLDSAIRYAKSRDYSLLFGFLGVLFAKAFQF